MSDFLARAQQAYLQQQKDKDAELAKYEKLFQREEFVPLLLAFLDNAFPGLFTDVEQNALRDAVLHAPFEYREQEVSPAVLAKPPISRVLINVSHIIPTRSPYRKMYINLEISSKQTTVDKRALLSCLFADRMATRIDITSLGVLVDILEARQ